MSIISESIQIRWADIDANRHLRHSVYYDYGASMRLKVLSERGLTTHKLEEFMIGPVLFREEAVFRREILFEDQIVLTVELVKASEDFGRWSLRHHFMKNGDTVAAIVNVDGAWIDLKQRKLAKPNDFIKNIFDGFPKAQDFQWVRPEQKA
ncbi:acyl-CoA thioesterase [Chryseosolibacter indicus]|uniref:Thioesterase family protein n=1 Tax=Chryseosolibacter indicus TaxID=2782351 RepID=A0ABS5VQD7_9BACT|nr:thioesterase family protein [Chryseosolibacter indicus]MBT1703012.1 thioesterase family protein [Chryseosolibacter indicus]